MTDIRFYHMTQKRLEQTLPPLLAKALEQFPRVVIKAGSHEQVAALDGLLWSYDPASFMPHGHQKDGYESQQPVWLTTEDDNPNQATMLVLVEGATSDHVGAFALCCEMFDGNDEDAVKAARARWPVYKEAGHELTYYQQDQDGRWLKK